MRWQSVRWTRLLTLLALLLPLTGWAQTPVTISTTTPYTQDFDGQGATGTAYEPGWLGIKASGTSTTVANGATLAPIVTDGSANSGAMYNVGAATTTERALGSLASAGIVPRFGAVFQNATGSTVTQVDLAGFMEQWRSASNATVLETLPFEFSFDATSLATGTWTAVAGMNLVEKLTASAAAAAVNGNLAANRTAISGTIGSLSWANGTTMWIRWSDTDNTGSDGIYALDDFSLTVTTASTVTLAEINLKQGATSYLTASTYSGFANTTLGSTDVKTFTVENLGGTALAVSSIVATGDFSVTGTVPTTVAANGTATFDVTFTPAATGTRTGTVTIASDDADEASYVVNLSAVGQASTPNPLIAISQAGTAYASASTFSGFANTTQGATSAPVTFTITNGSTTDALVIAGISTTGNFAVSGTAPTTVAAGGTATFDLTFGPTAAGTRTGTVTITNNSQGTPSYVISLSGEGTPPAPTATSYSATSLLAGILSNEVVSGTNLTGATVTVTGSTAGTVVVGTATATATQVSFTLLAPQAGSFTLNIATGGGTLTQTIDVTTPPAGFFEPFEAGSKSSTYASGNVTLTTGPWNFTEALLGNQPPSATPGSGEKKNNGQAVRFRTLGTATMNFDKANGAGTISFVAALYGTDAAQPTPATALLVEISTNGGTSYAPVGSITPTATLSPYSLTANVAGSIRLRFSSNTAGTTPRLNLDDLLVADYAAPVACAAPGTPAFGSITQTSAEVTVVAGPDGTGPFTVTATPTAGGSAITAAGASPISLTGLTAGTTYSVTVTSGCNAGFSSPSQASAAASLTTAAATPVPTLAVTQGGTSYPSAGTAYAFGNQTVGTTSAPVAFTLTNGGPDALTISGISTTGDYALSGAAPTTIAAGGTATVSATFAPTAAGTRAGTLVITSNATNAATYTVNLTGTGVVATPNPLIAVSQGGTAVANGGSYSGFASTTQGSTSAAVTFTIANGSPTDNLTLGTFALTGPFALSGTAPTSVAAGSSATFSLTFTPTAVGANTGTLRIPNNSQANNPYLINLSGQGTAPALTDLVVSSPQSVQGSYNNVTITNGGIANLTGTLNVASTLTVQPGGSLVQNCQLVTGAGSFVLQPGANLVICDPAGIASTGPVGAIQVSGSRSFSPDASYAYNGTVPQLTGAGLPSRVLNLVVGNATGVTLIQALSISSVVRLESGNLATNGQAFTLLSSATGTALVDNRSGIVVGTATVQRYIDPSRNSGVGYRHYSSPVANSTVADLATAGFAPVVNPSYNTVGNTVTPFPNVFGYDPARVNTSGGAGSIDFDKGFFSPTTTADALEVTRGYTVNLSAQALVDFVGTLNNGSLTATNLTRGPQSESGWHLRGNPYPAPLDWNAVGKAGVEDALYVFKSSGQYTGSYASYINNVGANGGTNVLPIAQGFFTRTAAGQTGTLTFSNTARLTTPDATPFQRGTADVRPQLVLSLSNATARTQAVVYFEQGATAGFDSAFDAHALPAPNGLTLATETPAAEPLAISGHPALAGPDVLLPLRVGSLAAGTFSLAVDNLANLPTPYRAYLRDALTGTYTDLTTTPSVGLSLTAGGAAGGRYAVLFTTQQRGLTTAPAALAQLASVYPNPARGTATLLLPAALRGTQATAVTVVDNVGRVVLARTLAAGTTETLELPLGSLAPGVYSVLARTAAGLVAKRLVVQ